MTGSADEETTRASAQWPLVFLAWGLVASPLAWGVWQTMRKAALLFR